MDRPMGRARPGFVPREANAKLADAEPDLAPVAREHLLSTQFGSMFSEARTRASLAERENEETLEVCCSRPPRTRRNACKRVQTPSRAKPPKTACSPCVSRAAIARRRAWPPWRLARPGAARAVARDLFPQEQSRRALGGARRPFARDSHDRAARRPARVEPRGGVPVFTPVRRGAGWEGRHGGPRASSREEARAAHD
eukprot:540540-Prymnesium_polylepis.1